MNTGGVRTAPTVPWFLSQIKSRFPGCWLEGLLSRLMAGLISFIKSSKGTCSESVFFLETKPFVGLLLGSMCFAYICTILRCTLVT